MSVTTADLEKDYKARIRATEDETEKRELTAEMREKIADVREANAARVELEAHRKAVAADKGIGEWEDMIQGSTPEEIDASAEKIAERVKTLMTIKSPEQDYGAPGLGGGGGGAVRPPRDPQSQMLDDVEQNYNSYKLGGDPLTAAQMTKYVNTRLGRHALLAFKDMGKKNYRDLDVSGIDRA